LTVVNIDVAKYIAVNVDDAVKVVVVEISDDCQQLIFQHPSKE
jgi:hypothetical protein